jgi:PEGA domain
MRWTTVARVGVAAALGAGCAAGQATTSLRVAGTVLDASVTVDEQYVGALAYVAAHGVALPPGKHRITVEKVGYFPWDKVVDAQGELIRLDVELTKIPD